MYLEAARAVMGGRDPKGTLREESANEMIIIPAYEMDITEAERREKQAAAV